VAENRQARGIPISVKLVLTTSIVIAAAVFTATWFSQTSINDLTEKQIAARRESGERSIVRESELLVQAVANAIVIPLSANMLGDVPKTLEDTLAADQKSENRVRWLVVLDPALGKVVAATEGAPAKLDDLDRRLEDGIRSTSSKVVHALAQGSDWVYATPIELGGTTHGQLYMGVSTAGLAQELTAALEQSQARSRATRNRVWVVGALVLAIGVVLVALQGVRLAAPIKELTRQANTIAAGDLRHRVPYTRRDELGVLARTFNFMADQIQHLLVSQREKASLEKEMALAREVQQAMLPSEALDEHGNLKIIGHCMPASSCGGDWWTYRKLSNGRMLLVVGDATGTASTRR
jgi:nitrogen fixation/metabolism regulation signal transduction histidine kinase